MKNGKEVLFLAKEIENKLKPLSKKIEVAGSIRRHSQDPGDIDIVLIPKDKNKLEDFMRTKGKLMEGGEHESTWMVDGIKVELYYTNEEEWGAELLAYSGRKGSNIGLRLVAKRKGMKLTQHGLFKKGKEIAGRTEHDIYAALGRKYKKPENR